MTSLVGPGLREALVSAGVLHPSSVDGLYRRSWRFEQVVRGIEALAHRTGAAEGGFEECLFLAPIMPRADFVKTDYLRSFPDLIGSIHVFQGGDRDHAELLRMADEGEDWTQALGPSEVMMCSAACHSVYTTMTGVLPVDGRRLELQGYCFRHEPSPDPARMQSFRMHEFVRIGTPEEAVAHRDRFLELGLEAMRSLGLPVEPVVANDPFFGRAGRMLARNQRDTELKYEIVCPVGSTDSPTAICSANYHLDHFGAPFDIASASGEVAHSACFGFGLERIALALFATHGADPAAWPGHVREALA